MPFFTSPTSFLRANGFLNNGQATDLTGMSPFTTAVAQPDPSTLQIVPPVPPPPPHSSHPSVPHLILLVFEAVLEVVCVSLPGYIVARMGMFDGEAQKFVANLNVMLFTPCLSMLPCDWIAFLEPLFFCFG